MSIVIGVIAAVVVIAAVLGALLVVSRQRRQRLQGQFGPEYDRAVQESGSRRAAERDLSERASRHESLDLRPLSPAAQKRYEEAWAATQNRFVDAPVLALAQADQLVQQVMLELGYPATTFEEQANLLSVEHGSVIEDYRAAHTTYELSQASEATTEQLRESLLRYRALFDRLLGGREGETPTNSDDAPSKRGDYPLQPGMTSANVQDPAYGEQSSSR